MPTATSPELIVPGSIYTPDSSPFSSAPAAFPNGDAGIVMNGSVASARMYQAAVSGVHYPASPVDPFTVIFWAFLNHATEGVVSGINTWFPTGMLFGVTDLTAATNSPTGTTTGFRWGICVDPASRRVIYRRAIGAAASSGVGCWNLPNTMCMISIQDPGNNGAPLFKINAVSQVDSLNFNSGSVGTPGALTDPHFALGPYVTTSGWTAPQRAITLGKVQLVHELLSDAEILDIYNSMVL